MRGRPWRRSPPRAQFRPVELFLELVKRIVADFLGFAQLEDRLPRGVNRAAAQRVGRQFATANSAILFGAQQQRAVFEPEYFGGLGWVAVDFIQRRAIG